jgi:hypothetical protein
MVTNPANNAPPQPDSKPGIASAFFYDKWNLHMAGVVSFNKGHGSDHRLVYHQWHNRKNNGKKVTYQ